MRGHLPLPLPDVWVLGHKRRCWCGREPGPRSTLFFWPLGIPREIKVVGSSRCALKKRSQRLNWASQVMLVIKNSPAVAGNASSIPGSGRSLEKDLASCSSILAFLENPTDGRAWQPISSGVPMCTRFETHTGSEPESHELRAASNWCLLWWKGFSSGFV